MAERRKFRFRYTLRALLVFITLFMLWGGYHTNRGWRERQAVAVLREHYAQIVEPPSPWYWPPGWYRRLVVALWGDRCIWQVYINPELAPGEVEALVALPSLERLAFNPQSRNGPEEPKFEDIRPVALPPGALPRILAAHSIWELSLGGCILSDDDWRAIAEEKSLTFLHVGGPSLSDRHLGLILSLPRLKSLQLGGGPLEGAPATGAGLLNHPGSESLKSIWSKGVPVGDEFAAFMAKCPNLREANFHDVNAGVEFTRRLENHASLEQLGVGRGLTDASVESLLTIPRLNRLALPQRILTPEVQASIAQRRPNLTVRASSN